MNVTGVSNTAVVSVIDLVGPHFVIWGSLALGVLVGIGVGLGLLLGYKS